MKRFHALTEAAVIAIHDELIARYGGLSGIRDRGALQSALARPLNIAAYNEDASIPELAAAYGWGLLRNHPFADGNKRIAIMAFHVALDLNGWETVCGEAEETIMILRAAAKEIDENAWIEWATGVSKKKSRRRH